MTQKTETVLDRMVADKREELAAAKAGIPIETLRTRAAEMPATRSFAGSLRGPRIGLIAEVKKASPSRGLLREDFDPVGLAESYAYSGASAISVLTDEKHFQGSLAHLRAIREALANGPPLLRKDFVFDEYQLYEARLAGADAVLLITAILEPAVLSRLIATSQSLGMDSLVEVHDEVEMERALDAGAQVVGINNRDLRTFHVDLATTERLAALVPGGRTIVAESGIFIRDDVDRLEAAGAHAVLIGEALVTARDPGAKIRELFG
jgi:indole-3-glycerol phosphate synthase